MKICILPYHDDARQILHKTVKGYYIQKNAENILNLHNAERIDVSHRRVLEKNEKKIKNKRKLKNYKKSCKEYTWRAEQPYVSKNNIEKNKK